MSKIGEKIIATLKASLLDLHRKTDDQHCRHINFICDAALRDDPLIKVGVASLSIVVWNDIRDATRCRMPLPVVVADGEGGVRFTWDRDEHHLEFDAAPDEPGFFLYRNRKTGEARSGEYNLGDDLADELVDRLWLFVEG